ncbi:exodeoxyribonuclease VII small subunit [Vibrio tapetis]|uniref:Uncharacterized protein n=1 Tax=Vibrio tapetis subsp. tapetis TaxID=1671868 RepID=A0A2N8ZAU4_9VIBR|nr:exodeoxyribonuclease VII small subunit [Vibrio tapetis]SON49040.1 conserved protein of unknown function [Vibrio tapetis subsp. tapetis]
MNKQTKKYLESYKQLKDAAKKLQQNSEEVDVDQIIPLVEQGTQAYEHCMSRILQVEKMLKSIESKHLVNRT